MNNSNSDLGWAVSLVHWVFWSVIVCFISVGSGCRDEGSETSSSKYKVVHNFPLRIREPSGLALGQDKKHLWAVSDHNSNVYKLALDGSIIESFKVDARDVEGIAVISDTILCVLSESSSELIFVRVDGKEIKRKSLTLLKRDNHGYEGLTYDPLGKRYFVIKEKQPGYLLEMDLDFKVASSNALAIASDLSGLDYDSGTGTLWISSDESKAFANITSQGKTIARFTVPFKSIEGLAFNAEKKLLYLVSDKQQMLYVLSLQ